MTKKNTKPLEIFIYKGSGAWGRLNGSSIFLATDTQVHVVRISLTDPNEAFVRILGTQSIIQVKRAELQKINLEDEENECLGTADYSPELVDLSEQLNSLEGYQLDNLSKSTQTPNLSSHPSSQESPSIQTFEITNQPQENLTSLQGDGHAIIPALPETEPELMESSPSSGEKCYESSASSSPSLSSWNNLKNLSAEDFERCLEDSEWLDIHAGIYNSYQQRSSERRISATEYLPCPTPTSSDSGKSRPAGITKYEQWFKNKGIVPTGSQLSAQAMSLLLGFPVDWMNALSPYHPDIPAGSTPESLLGEPLLPGRQVSPSIESSILIPSFNDDRESLLITLIKRDGGTQSRAAIDYVTVQDYVQALLAGDRFPPIVVYHDGSEYWLADGFHRMEAYTRCQQETIPVSIKQGTRRDAVLHSVGANATHGLRRSNFDKHRAVELLLQDEEWSQWSNREIGRTCGVSDVFVSKLRKSLLTVSSDNDGEQPLQREYINRWGQRAQMNTGGLRDRGSSKKKKPPDPKWKDAHLTATPNPPSANFKSGDTIELINPPSESGWSVGDRVIIAEVFHDSRAVLIEMDGSQTNLFKRFSFEDIRLIEYQPPEKLPRSEADDLREQLHRLQEDATDLMRERERLAQENKALKQEREILLQNIDHSLSSKRQAQPDIQALQTEALEALVSTIAQELERRRKEGGDT